MTEWQNILDGFSDRKILVLGDLMLDRFIFGDVTRISPEAPVPIVHATSQSVRPGGAANTANNLRTLGAKVRIAGVIGNDAEGRELLQELARDGIDTEGVYVDESRPTTVKTRVFSLNQQIIRIDKESKAEIGDDITEKIIRYVKKAAAGVDAIVVSDYGKGVITHEIIKAVTGNGRGIPVVVDPDLRNFLIYKNITAFVSNQRDVTEALGIPIINETSLRNTGYKLLSSLCCEGVVITRGREGLVVFDKQGSLNVIETVPLEVFDITGVSDTVTSALTLALASGASLADAAWLANQAARIVIGKVGTATVEMDELREALKEADQR